MKLPPKQIAVSVGHFLHSPGLFIIASENELFAGHSMHLINIGQEKKSYCPESVNFSPGKHCLTYNSSEKSISETMGKSFYKKLFDDILLYF
jgi:hypothetical protein